MAPSIDIEIRRIERSKIESIDFDNLKFGTVQSDHMLVVDYRDGAWQKPVIMPYQNLSYSPSLFSLHYGQTIFEGMKAYRNIHGDVVLFRPDAHAKRLNVSAKRLCMPELPEETFLAGLYELLRLDQAWVSGKKGNSLYIRPMMFATDETLGVAPSKTYRFIIFTCPVSTYYSGSVKVMVETQYVRASEGGTGFIKCGGNYGASLLPAKLALEKGYQQILWTDGVEHKYIEESGTMNVMFQIGDTIVTPKLNTSILAGVTRDSVVKLAAKWGQPLQERLVSVDEIIAAQKAGTLADAFGTGTAAVITHITDICYQGVDYTIPSDSSRTFSNKVMDYLTKVKVGEADDYMNWMVKM